MSGRAISPVAPALGGRVAAASASEPLSALAAEQRAELAAVLDRVNCFEDLPGKWQAALLAAEAARDDGPAAPGVSRCCGGG